MVPLELWWWILLLLMVVEEMGSELFHRSFHSEYDEAVTWSCDIVLSLRRYFSNELSSSRTITNFIFKLNEDAEISWINRESCSGDFKYLFLESNFNRWQNFYKLMCGWRECLQAFINRAPAVIVAIFELKWPSHWWFYRICFIDKKPSYKLISSWRECLQTFISREPAVIIEAILKLKWR